MFAIFYYIFKSRRTRKHNSLNFQFDPNRFKKLFGAEKSCDLLSTFHESNQEVNVEPSKVEIDKYDDKKKTLETASIERSLSLDSGNAKSPALQVP